jgi:hypothetical protein
MNVFGRGVDSLQWIDVTSILLVGAYVHIRYSLLVTQKGFEWLTFMKNVGMT